MKKIISVVILLGLFINSTVGEVIKNTKRMDGALIQYSNFSLETDIRVTPSNVKPKYYKFGGVSVSLADQKHAWYLSLVERPVKYGSKHFLELALLWNGKFHAEKTECKKLFKRNTEKCWESGKKYRLSLVLSGNVVLGRLIDPQNGKILAETAYEVIGNAPREKLFPGKRVGNSEVDFSDFKVEEIKEDDSRYIANPILLNVENASFDAKRVEIVKNLRCGSGGKGMRLRSDIKADVGPNELSFQFNVVKDGEFRFRSHIVSNSKNKRIYSQMRLDDLPVKQRVIFPSARRGQAWENLMYASLKAGKHTLQMQIPEGIIFDVLQIVQIASRQQKIPEIIKKYQPTILPKKGAHPRLLMRKEHLSKIKKNAKTSENAPIMSLVRKHAAAKLTCPSANGVTKFSYGYLAKIESKAFVYALEGDKKIGREAIDAIKEYIAKVDFDNIMDVTRLIGRTIFSTALVYDWCYPLLNESEKKELYAAMIRLGYDSEIGWFPMKQSVINGHGNEAQLSRNFLAMAIAVFDEDPEPWQVCSYRILKEMVPAHNYEYRSGRHAQGSNYGPCRFRWDLHAMLTFQQLCGVDIFSEDIKKLPFFWIYLLQPNFELFDDADVWMSKGKEFQYPEPFFNMYVVSEDPIIKGEFLRQNGLNWAKLDPVFFLIFNRPEIVANNDFSKLSLTKSFHYPLSSMIARSSWEMGENSPAAVVDLKGALYKRRDHQHMDSGAFQVYFRAPLLVDLGAYGHWGGQYDIRFAKRTIAHNCMLFYDPEEKFQVPGNDGGQRFSRVMPRTIQQVIDHPEIHENGKLIAEDVGPDAQLPLYSYLHSDLAAAYSNHKVKSYERVFVYFNLGKVDNPALLFVFDHTETTKSKYKKFFLLNSPTKPEIRNNIFSISNRLPDHPAGQARVTTLLPKSIEVESKGNGNAMEFFKEKVTMPSKNRSLSLGWRTMISPSIPSKEDLFLNVIQIGDPHAESFPATMTEDESRIYATAADVLVAFPQNGQMSKAPAKFSISSETRILLTGMSAGEYCIEKDGKVLWNTVSKEKAGTIFFIAAPGSYLIKQGNGGKPLPDYSNRKAAVPSP